jgi:hypothetical protein
VEQKRCSNCKWYKCYVTDDYYCMNDNSDYADCPCEANDTCDEWEEKD